VKLSGCTVHFADTCYDHGPIILQAAVPVEDTDTVESLAARVFAAECALYPQAIQLFAQDRLHIVGRRVHILPAASS
jgi:folate-dependent phosphoribosylglycinamide formyltransferase PurN